MYANAALTGHPSEMDFPSVDTNDCGASVGIKRLATDFGVSFC